MSARPTRPANGDDRRPRTRAEERIAELDTSPAGLAAEMDELREQLLRAEKEAEENRLGWQRTAADFSNFRRRTEQDRQQMFGLANEALLVKVLNLADDFDRAIANMPAGLEDNGWVEGIVAIDRKLRALLESEGLTPIEAQGTQFDPHQHEAVVQQETSAVPEGTVTAELQRGYRLRDRVLSYEERLARMRQHGIAASKSSLVLDGFLEASEHDPDIAHVVLPRARSLIPLLSTPSRWDARESAPGRGRDVHPSPSRVGNIAAAGGYYSCSTTVHPRQARDAAHLSGLRSDDAHAPRGALDPGADRRRAEGPHEAEGGGSAGRLTPTNFEF